MLRRTLSITVVAGLALALAGPAAARNVNATNTYALHKLVADQPGVATHTDPNLVNAWGLTANSASPWWVANNGTSTSTLYFADGTPRSLVVTVPSAPTGAVFNGTGQFPVSNGGATGTSVFLFATEEGTILGWNPGVPPSSPPAASTQAFPVASAPGAIYKGLAIGTAGSANYLYASDFHNARVDVFDGDFALMSWPGAFVDPGIPAGYGPFGIQNLGGRIYVTFAKQDADAEDEIAGEGLGFVSVFGTDGTFIGRVVSGDDLNAPWGLAWAPGDFGKFSGDLLVGNFGDGRIHAFAPTGEDWEDRGPLKGTDHRPISIDGLWAIAFGNGGAAGLTNELYFTAGPDDESHGLFGSVTKP